MMASTRVQRRCRRPRKGRQSLPQFGGRLDPIDKTFLRGFKGLFQLTNYVRRQKEKRQKGGRINAYIKTRTSM